MPARLNTIFSQENSQPINETFLVGSAESRQNPVLRCALQTSEKYDYFAIYQGGHCLAANDFHSYFRRNKDEYNQEIELYTFNEEKLNWWTPWGNWSSCSAACGNGTQQRWRYCFPNRVGRKNCTETHDFEEQACNTDECPWNYTAYKYLGCRRIFSDQSLFTESMEGKDEVLDLPLEERLVTKDKCAYVTWLFNRTIFAITGSPPICLNSENEEVTYNMYPNSTAVRCVPYTFVIYTLKDGTVDAQWGPWLPGGFCSQTCDGGSVRKIRPCNNPPVTDGADCPGNSYVDIPCDTPPCPTTLGPLIRNHFTTENLLTTENLFTTESLNQTLRGRLAYLDVLITGVEPTWNDDELKKYIKNVTSEASEILAFHSMEDADVIHVIKAMEDFASKVMAVLDPGTNYTIHKENIDFYVEVHTLKPDMRKEGLQATPQVKFLPSSFQQFEFDATVNQYLGVATLSYNNMQEWIQPTSHKNESENLTYSVVSEILSVSTFPPIETTFDEVDVVLKLNHHDKKNGKPLCSFINESISDFWSQVGCHMLNSSDLYTYCVCNHLTAFGVLMRVHKVKIEEVHERALSLITYVCSTLSLFCLLSAFALFTLLR
ncbi:uncharacterized protein LOC117115084 isoform X2 [Anneissia japonica]|uniref:uncharacterized protein LOC117115084 isoform X2 n=1 Tax=Anneissia japonica TaxID=1529436 RepID=UPI001425B385|nr:uncharacterized protein LOC117115084 isoform X2 [Anneissia japonica]